MSSLSYHLTLLGDVARTRAFDRALAETIRPGDVVADLGCGSGILSLFALKYGASHVYAVDHHPIAAVARLAARENGVEDRLTVIQAPSHEVRLPRRVDVVVSEVLGNAVFDEAILETMADARRRLLKPDGRTVPSALSLMAAPSLHFGGPSRWKYGVKLEALRAMALHQFSALERPRLCAPVKRLWRSDVGKADLPVRLDGRWRVKRADGVGVWFDAQLSPNVRLNSFRGTSWVPVLFPAPARLEGIVDFHLEYHGRESYTWRFNDLPAQGSDLADELALSQLALKESDVPRLPRTRAKQLRELALVDGRRTIGQIARLMKGVPYREAVWRVKSLCLNEKLIW